MSHLPSKPMDVAHSPNLYPARSPNPPDRAHIPHPPDVRAPNPYLSDARELPPPREGAGFTRSGFAPVPYRHAEMERRGSNDRPFDDYDRRDERDDYDRKRRRSPSPSYPSHRARMSASPPRRDYRASAPTPSDPASVPYQLNFKQFAEWFRESHPHTARQDDEEWRQLREDVERGNLPDSALKTKIGMARRFERYRKEYYSRQLYSLFLSHRTSAWFIERYSPASDPLRRRVDRSGRVPAVAQFITELRAGKYAGVSYDEVSRSRAMDRPLDDSDDKRVEVEAPPGQVFVKTVPPSTRREDLEKLFGKAAGFKWLALSDPSVKKQFHRVGWAQYAEGTDLESVVRTIDGQKIDTFTFHMGINNSPSIGRIRHAPPVCNTPAQLARDLERAKELAIMLENALVEDATTSAESDPAAPAWEVATPLHERGSLHVQEVIDSMTTPDAGDEAAKLLHTKSALDLWIAYLRNGLHTCYYCLAPCSFAEELHRKCISHIRAPAEFDDDTTASAQQEQAAGDAANGHDREAAERDDRDNERDVRPDRRRTTARSNDERWADLFDGKFRAMVKGDVEDAGGRDLQEETNKLAAPFIKQETADKYRCKQCDKLFRAPEFVVKHIASKHGEVIEEKLAEVTLFNAFASDATHLQPDKNTPAAIEDKLPAVLPLMLDGVMGAYGQQPPVMSFGHNGPAVNPALMPGAAGVDGPGFNLQQQMMMMLQMGMMMGAGGGGGRGGGSAMGGMATGMAAGGTGMAGPMSQRPRRDLDAPPPAGGPVPEDPRASRGRVSYLDLDEEPGGAGDGGLPY